MKRKYNTRSSKNKKTKDDDDMSDFIVPDDVVEYESDVSDIPEIDINHDETDDIDNDIEWMEKMGKTFSLLWEFRPSNIKKRLKEKEEYFIDEEDIDEESEENSDEESDYETMDEEELEDKFLKKLSQSEKKELKEKEKEIGKYRDNKVPMKFRILRSTIPNDLKAKCLDELEVLQNMDSSTGEYNKKMRWLDYIINIPW